MTRGTRTSLAAAVLVAASVAFTAAENVKFKHVVSVYADDAGVGFNAPEGVACGSQGQAIVADTGNDRLVRLTIKDGTTTPGAAITVPQLTAPSRVQLSSKGDIYAIDDKQHRVVHLAADGTFKESLRVEGLPAPSTIVPKGLAIDSTDRLYVLDVFGGRVLVVDAHGALQRVVGLPADVGFASDVTVDDSGNLLVLDAVQRRLLIASADAKAFTPVDKDLRDILPTIPTSLVASKGSIFIVEGIASRVTTLLRDGSFVTRQLAFGFDEGALNHPAQMCVDDKDDAFIADRGNQRVAVFQLIR